MASTKKATKKTAKTLAERLALIRGDRSQRQFARELGIFQQNQNRYENGTTPHLSYLERLAAEGVDLNWLVTGKGAAPKPAKRAS